MEIGAHALPMGLVSDEVEKSTSVSSMTGVKVHLAVTTWINVLDGVPDLHFLLC